MISDLKMHLEIPETRRATIAEIATLYSICGSIAKTAVRLGVSYRTLERAIAEFPELSTAIDRARARK